MGTTKTINKQNTSKWQNVSKKEANSVKYNDIFKKNWNTNKTGSVIYCTWKLGKKKKKKRKVPKQAKTSPTVCYNDDGVCHSLNKFSSSF